MTETKNQQTATLSGNLEEAPFASVFYQLASQKKTGIMDICTAAPPEGKIVKRLILSKGVNVYVQGGSVEETLARILVVRGRLSEEKYQALKQAANGDYKKLDEQAIRELNLNPVELGELYQYQAELKVKNCFALARGFYQFRETSPQDLQKYLLAPMVPEKLMASAIAEHYPQARIEKEFDGIRKKTFAAKPELAQNLNLFGFGPKEQRWIRGLGKEFVFAQAVGSSGLKPEQAEQILLALYLAGYLELPNEEEDFPLGRAYLPVGAKEKKPIEKKPVEEKKLEEKPAVRKEEPKLPIEEMLDRKMSDQELLAEIDKMLELVNRKETTYFELMGVDELATPALVKRIYFKMARLFHPDAKPDLYKGEVRNKVETVFTRIGEAYNTLIDPEAKKQYLDRLRTKVSDAEMEKANRAIQAEMEFQKATIAIRRGAFKEAITALDAAIHLVPDEPEYQIYMGYCLFKTQGVSSAPRVSKMIEEALKQRPKVAEGWYYLGVIFRVTGELEKARDYFKKALELDNYHQESQRELRVIEMKLAEAPKKGRKK